MMAQAADTVVEQYQDDQMYQQAQVANENETNYCPVWFFNNDLKMTFGHFHKYTIVMWSSIPSMYYY